RNADPGSGNTADPLRETADALHQGSSRTASWRPRRRWSRCRSGRIVALLQRGFDALGREAPRGQPPGHPRPTPCTHRLLRRALALGGEGREHSLDHLTADAVALEVEADPLVPVAPRRELGGASRREAVVVEIARPFERGNGTRPFARGDTPAFESRV